MKWIAAVRDDTATVRLLRPGRTQAEPERSMADGQPVSDLRPKIHADRQFLDGNSPTLVRGWTQPGTVSVAA